MTPHHLHNLPRPGNPGQPVAETDHNSLGLGWLLDEHGAALLRADDAAKRVHAAQIAGDINARNRAALDREDAIRAVYAIKEKAARFFLFGARCAAELHPGATQTYLDPVFRRELDVTQEAIVEAEERIDQVENAILKLEAVRPEVAQ